MLRTEIQSRTFTLSQLGTRVFLCACLMLGLIQAYFGESLPQLHPGALRSLPYAFVSAALLAVPAIWQLSRTGDPTPSIILALYWGLAAIWSLATMATPGSGLSWVPVAETGLFAIASLRAVWPIETRLGDAVATAARSCTAIALIFFGCIHIVNREAISGLIPQWIPAANYWPWVTGSILAAAGIAIGLRKFSDLAAIVIAAMFGSWIILVHTERVMSRPESIFEWTFALTAFALIGVVLMAAQSASIQIRRFGPLRLTQRLNGAISSLTGWRR